MQIKAGDWRCNKCNDWQFAKNKTCKMCGASKPTNQGDWTCEKCGDLQFARRVECRKCGALKPTSLYEQLTGHPPTVLTKDDPRIQEIIKLIEKNKDAHKCKCPTDDPHVIKWLTDNHFLVQCKREKRERWCPSCSMITHWSDCLDSAYVCLEKCPQIEYVDVLYIHWS